MPLVFPDSSSTTGGARRAGSIAALALGGLLISSLALALVGASSTPRPKATAAPALAASAAAPSLRVVPLPATPPARLEPTGAPKRLAQSPETQAATLKPPVAFAQNIAHRPLPRIGEKPRLISDGWRAHHERLLRAANRATAKVVFLGDSITEGWGVAPAYREHFGQYSPLNLGLAGDTTQNVLWRIEHGELDGTQPQVVVLMIGINNLAGGFSTEDTSDGVRAVVAAVQAHLPNARVLLLAILPARQDPANPLRQRIQEANRLLESLVKPGRVELHDLGSALLEPDGTILKSTLRDFVHPTPDGFERLSRALSPLLEALLATPASEAPSQ